MVGAGAGIGVGSGVGVGVGAGEGAGDGAGVGVGVGVDVQPIILITRAITSTSRMMVNICFYADSPLDLKFPT